MGLRYPAWLDELVASATLFEVWAHEACIAPIEDYPLHRRALETWNHWAVNRTGACGRSRPRGCGRCSTPCGRRTFD